MQQKDYINVDELFQNWKDRADTPPTDLAWKRMNNILDKELPTEEKRKRRWFIPLLGLLCTIGGTAMGVGGMYYYQHNNPETANKNTNSSTESYSAPTQNISQSPIKNTGANTAITNNQVIDKESAMSRKEQNVVRPISNNNNLDNTTSAIAASPSVASITTNKVYNNPVNHKPKQSGIKFSKQSHTNTAVNKLAKQSSMDAQAIEFILNENNKIAKQSPEKITQDQYQVEQNKTVKLQSSLVESETITATTYIKSPIGIEYIKNDNIWFKKIEKPTLYKVANKRYIADDKYEIQDGNALVNISQLEPLPISNTSQNVTSNSSIAHTSSMKSNSNSEKMTANKVWEDLQMRSNPFLSWLFSSHSFNPILAVGMHYSSVFNNAMGYNLGFGVRYNTKNNVKVNAMINYQHSFLGNYIYTDHAKSYNVSLNGNTYAGEEVTTENYYTLKSIQQLQLPIYLQYHFVRDFYLSAGANINYVLPINYNTDSYKKINDNYASLTAPQSEIAKINAHRDFDKSMGVGYILGFGYNANNRMQFDLKMQQMIYNSNQSASYLGKELYGKPSFHLQVTYNLGKK